MIFHFASFSHLYEHTHKKKRQGKEGGKKWKKNKRLKELEGNVKASKAEVLIFIKKKKKKLILKRRENHSRISIFEIKFYDDMVASMPHAHTS